MLTPFYGARASGFWGERGTNMLDTGAPFYEVYECADGAWIATGAIEPQFYAALLDVLGLAGESLPDRDDPAMWPGLKQRFAAVFATRTRDEWCALADGRDTCLAPVLSPLEAPSHPHNVARHTFLEIAGVPQPAPAPRFSRTAPAPPAPPVNPGGATTDTLKAWGFTPDDVATLVASGALV
jgi:alpha-methylacyl-CoA racemase